MTFDLFETTQKRFLTPENLGLATNRMKNHRAKVKKLSTKGSAKAVQTMCSGQMLRKTSWPLTRPLYATETLPAFNLVSL